MFTQQKEEVEDFLKMLQGKKKCHVEQGVALSKPCDFYSSHKKLFP